MFTSFNFRFPEHFDPLTFRSFPFDSGNDNGGKVKISRKIGEWKCAYKIGESLGKCGENGEIGKNEKTLRETRRETWCFSGGALDRYQKNPDSYPTSPNVRRVVSWLPGVSLC
jgi:hypothetical protein